MSCGCPCHGDEYGLCRECCDGKTKDEARALAQALIDKTEFIWDAAADEVKLAQFIWEFWQES